MKQTLRQLANLPAHRLQAHLSSTLDVNRLHKPYTSWAAHILLEAKKLPLFP